jgi:hypothetical protein
MKALSIRQPWAELIMRGIKDVENRSWCTEHRDTLAIHAARTFDLNLDNQKSGGSMSTSNKSTGLTRTLSSTVR